MYAQFAEQLEAIRSMGINELSQRPQALCDLAASIVNFETEDGQLTYSDTGLCGQDYWSTLKPLLRDNGFTFLGAGHFSAAFSHELLPERAIKIGFKKEDSGAAYVAYCRLNQGKAGIPNIYAVSRHAGCYTVVLDLLEGYNDMEDEEETKLSEDYQASKHVITYSWTVERAVSAYPRANRELLESAEGIREFFTGIASFDMHRGNIMVDKSGSLVITDPVSWTKEERLSRNDFKIDPDELIKELAETELQVMIDKALTRHLWKANKARVRKEKRKAAKQHRKEYHERRARNKQERHERMERHMQEIKEVRHLFNCEELVHAITTRNDWQHDRLPEMQLRQNKAINKLQQALAVGGEWVADKRRDAQFFMG